MSTERVVIVTGAARGIGAAIAEAFAEAGCAVVLTDIDGSELTRTVERLKAREQVVLGVEGDVTRAEDIDRITRSARDRFGRIDVLVNNAGRNTYLDPISMTEHDWDDALSTDLKSAWLMARAVLPSLLQVAGAIVNVSSIHGKLTTPGMFPYAVAKSGLEGLTRSLAVEYAPHGVRVNAVAPGWTHTRLVDDWVTRGDDSTALEKVLAAHPLRRIAQPRDVAAAALFLAGDGAQAITGAILPVDCGLSITFRVD